jgi:two-component system OmpR family response regulator
MARILVVEDNESLLRLLCEYLRMVSHDPVPVETAAQARDAAKGGPWDLVIADRLLPDGEDGQDLLPLFPGTPVLTISGERPADLKKPFSLAELGAAIHQKLAEAG